MRRVQAFVLPFPSASHGRGILDCHSAGNCNQPDQVSRDTTDRSTDQDKAVVCKEVDQALATLVLDLKQRGLPDNTIVIWGGQFGRTSMRETRNNTGWDHHIDAYTMWTAEGGFKSGTIHRKKDEPGLGRNDQAKHVHDFQATVLHQPGLDHERLTYRFQGRDFRLTDAHGNVLHKLIA